MDKYTIAPPAGSTNNSVGAADRPWKEGHFENIKMGGGDLGAYLAESTGYGIVSGCEPSISGLTVSVAAGVIHLANGTRKEIAATTVTLDAADSTNPRIDLVYITSTGEVAKITGTAAASPVVSTLPSGGISVAQVSVAAGATTGTVADTRGMLFTLKYNYVSYRMFGAKLNGLDDDSNAVIQAHNYANMYNLPVIEHGGTLKCNFTVEVKTDCDLALTFVLDDNMPQSCYNIIPDEEIEDKTYAGTIDKTMYNDPTGYLSGKVAVLSLNNTSWYLGKRGGTGADSYHLQVVAFDEFGRRLSAPILAQNTGTFSVKNIQNLTERAISFKGGLVKNNSTNISGFRQLIACKRNNTEISRFIIENPNISNLVPSTAEDYKGGLIDLDNVANCKVTNIVGFNNDNSTGFSNGYSGYIVSASCCFNTIFSKIDVSQYWGALASLFCDTMFFSDLITNRIDCHYGTTGSIQISNVKFVELATLTLGYGDYDVFIDNCVWQKNGEIDVNTPTIQYRRDFANKFIGKLFVSNSRLSATSTMPLIMMAHNKTISGNTLPTEAQQSTIKLSNCMIDTYGSNTIIGNYDALDSHPVTVSGYSGGYIDLVLNDCLCLRKNNDYASGTIDSFGNTTIEGGKWYDLSFDNNNEIDVKNTNITFFRGINHTTKITQFVTLKRNNFTAQGASIYADSLDIIDNRFNAYGSPSNAMSITTQPSTTKVNYIMRNICRGSSSITITVTQNSNVTTTSDDNRNMTVTIAR